MFGHTRELTDEEIVGILSHTLIPTVVIEGKEDLFLFRRVQEDIGAANISLLAVGGRSRVIFAFRNKPDPPSTTLMFYCDKDEWVFTPVPQEFDQVNFEMTDGYSIENDLLRDSNPVELMYPDEVQKFEAELERFIQWFAIQMARYLRGEDANLGKFPGRVLDDEAEYAADCEMNDLEDFPHDIVEQIAIEPLRSIRGKSVLQIVSRQLNASQRTARHQPKALLEAAAAGRGDHYQRVLNWVRNHLADQD